MNLRFHWMLPKGGEVAPGAHQSAQAAAQYRLESTRGITPAPKPDITGWQRFARNAEDAGIDSLLVSFSRYEPDPFVVSCALGQVTSRLKFIAAYRSGLMQPTTFVQQVNTVAALTNGRISLNIVAGSSSTEQRGYGDFFSHDERYLRAEEFLEVCNSFWRANGEVNFEGKYYRVDQGKLHTPFLSPDRAVPEIYASGHSEPAERLALAQASCLLRAADTPDKLRPTVERVREHGLEVCLRMCVLCRPTREEAVNTAQSLLPQNVANENRITTVKDDSQMYREAAQMSDHEDNWLTPTLWKGLVPYYGPVWITLLGTREDLKEAFLEYMKIGVSQFILSGWPELDEVQIFGREVLPLVRQAEAESRA
ncbi:MAG TPA: LLM class flavin-dependent oxidoreductase [Pyrinomonadaceae bacterium]|nr:LLM class flavin-dependent oxidoreductase [Pyrinomonadaceae bacterium]